MSLKKQIILSTLVLISAGVVIFGYQQKDIVLFWKIHDLGILMLVLSFIYMTLDLFIINIALWLLSTFVLNSAITSWFYNVTIFGNNQKIFGIIAGTAFITFGIVYNYFKHFYSKKQNRLNNECKRDAKDKYKTLINRMESMEDKMDEKLSTLDNFLNRLANG